MGNHRRSRLRHHNHPSHGFAQLFPSSCRFNTLTDVIESVQNPNNLHQTQKHPSKSETKGRKCSPVLQSLNVKQSSSSNSGLFSTEEDEEGEDSEIEIDNYFSLSSDSTLSSCPEIGYSHRGLGFSSWRRDEVRISEMGHCSSSETSTSSSINSNSPLKDPNPRLRSTLSEKLGYRSTTSHKETGDTEDLFSNSTIYCRKTGKTKHIYLNSSVSGLKTEKISQKTGEISQKTEHLCTESSVFRRNTERLGSKSPDSGRNTAKIHQISEAWLCPIYLRGKIEKSYAVEKESRDPYGDFRESMVEMIVEKKISGAGDLQKLLLCFLSLNSSVHRRVILQVFSDISEGLITR